MGRGEVGALPARALPFGPWHLDLLRLCSPFGYSILSKYRRVLNAVVL